VITDRQGESTSYRGRCDATGSKIGKRGQRSDKTGRVKMQQEGQRQRWRYLSEWKEKMCKED
jgi:hypothetical protein